MSNPRVSVIMAAYNSGHYIAEAIQSILNQYWGAFELIVTCDPSQDNTLDIVKHYADLDSRIIVLSHEQRLGPAESMNRAIKVARGELIAILDSDDVSLPTRLQKQVEYLDSHPDIGVLGTGIEIIDSRGKHWATHHPPTDVNTVRWIMLLGDCIANSSAMIRADIFRQVGLYNIDDNTDDDFWARALLATKITNMPDVLLQYRVWGGSGSSTRMAQTEKAAISTMQLKVKSLLDIDLSSETATVMRNLVTGRRIYSLEHIKEASDLLNGLYWAYTKKYPLNNAEIDQINQDVSTKLCLLAFWAGRLSFTKGLALLMQGLKLSRRPLYVLPAESAKKRFMRLARGNMDW